MCDEFWSLSLKLISDVFIRGILKKQNKKTTENKQSTQQNMEEFELGLTVVTS